MSLDVVQAGEGEVLTSVDALSNYLRRGEKKPGKVLVGLEHEKILFRRDTSGPVPYEGANGIGEIFRAFAAKGISEFREGPDRPPIAGIGPTGASVTVEPGGQFEFSGSPFPTARAAHAENLHHLAQLREFGGLLGYGVAFVGYRPFGQLKDMPWMPKLRYAAMRESLGNSGALARDMMLMTATGQVNLDWTSEEDAAEKVTAAARVTPILVALYANSPIIDGKYSGFASYRSHVWTQVDASRTGYPDCIIDGGFTYARYVDWALDAPLLFLRRNAGYVRPAQTFRQLLASGWDGAPLRLSDWSDHLTTMFPEVRVKHVFEVRGADCASPALTGSLLALLRGLLYAPSARRDLLKLLPYESPEGHRSLHLRAQREGLRAKAGPASLLEIAREVLELATKGLREIDSEDLPLLEPLRAIAASGRAPADEFLEAFARDPRAAATMESLENASDV